MIIAMVPCTVQVSELKISVEQIHQRLASEQHNRGRRESFRDHCIEMWSALWLTIYGDVQKRKKKGQKGQNTTNGEVRQTSGRPP